MESLPTKRTSPHSRFRIRTAAPTDAESIASLGSETFALTFGHSLDREDLAAYLEDAYTPSQIALDLLDPLKDTVVACDAQGRLLGFAMLTRGTMEECISGREKPIQLQRLYVRPDSHGSGIGKALVGTLEGLAREKAFKTMWLGVWEENVKAQGAYLKMGFQVVGTHDFRMGQCVQTDLIMAKLFL